MSIEDLLQGLLFNQAPTAQQPMMMPDGKLPDDEMMMHFGHGRRERDNPLLYGGDTPEANRLVTSEDITRERPQNRWHRSPQGAQPDIPPMGMNAREERIPAPPPMAMNARLSQDVSNDVTGTDMDPAQFSGAPSLRSLQPPRRGGSPVPERFDPFGLDSTNQRRPDLSQGDDTGMMGLLGTPPIRQPEAEGGGIGLPPLPPAGPPAQGGGIGVPPFPPRQPATDMSSVGAPPGATIKPPGAMLPMGVPGGPSYLPREDIGPGLTIGNNMPTSGIPNATGAPAMPGGVASGPLPRGFNPVGAKAPYFPTPEMRASSPYAGEYLPAGVIGGDRNPTIGIPNAGGTPMENKPLDPNAPPVDPRAAPPPITTTPLDANGRPIDEQRGPGVRPMPYRGPAGAPPVMRAPPAGPAGAPPVYPGRAPGGTPQYNGPGSRLAAALGVSPGQLPMLARSLAGGFSSIKNSPFPLETAAHAAGGAMTGGHQYDDLQQKFGQQDKALGIRKRGQDLADARAKERLGIERGRLGIMQRNSDSLADYRKAQGQGISNRFDVAMAQLGLKRDQLDHLSGMDDKKFELALKKYGLDEAKVNSLVELRRAQAAKPGAWNKPDNQRLIEVDSRLLGPEFRAIDKRHAVPPIPKYATDQEKADHAAAVKDAQARAAEEKNAFKQDTYRRHGLDRYLTPDGRPQQGGGREPGITEEEFNALEPGAWYKHPDDEDIPGQYRKKPGKKKPPPAAAIGPQAEDTGESTRDETPERDDEEGM